MKRIVSFMLALFVIFGGTFSLFSTIIQANAESKTYLTPGGDLVGTINETVSYSNRTVAEYINPYNIPNYSMSTICGVTAGVNLIAWYNRPYPALIPGHTAGSMVFGKWKWAAQNSTIDNLFPTLYSLMGATSGGVTINGYLGGINSYVSGKNLSFSSYSLMNNGMLNQNYKTELSNGKLLSVFLDGFNISSGPIVNSGYDQLILEEYTGTHIMVVYGWTDISYYNAQNVMFRKDVYLHVSTGFGSNGMLLISRYCTVDNVYTTHVS